METQGEVLRTVGWSSLISLGIYRQTNGARLGEVIEGTHGEYLKRILRRRELIPIDLTKKRPEGRLR